MLTTERLERLRREVAVDDEVLGKDKKQIVQALDFAIKKYKQYEMKEKLTYLEGQIEPHMDQEAPEKVKKEAMCLLVDLIDRNCQEEGIDFRWLIGFKKDYLIALIKLYKVEGHNKEVCEVALGIKPYNPAYFQLRLNYDKDKVEGHNKEVFIDENEEDDLNDEED